MTDKEQDAERRGRTQGVVFAAAFLAKYHDQTTIAEEILKAWGTDLKDARKNKCDAGDIKALREAKVW